MKNTVKEPAEAWKLKPATLLKVTLWDGCFSYFVNCTNDTIAQSISYSQQYSNSNLHKNVPRDIQLYSDISIRG